MPAFIDKLKRLHACDEAVDWASGCKSGKEAWETCERGDWLLWVCGKLSGPPESDGRKKLVLCACECARLALPHTKDPRVLACIETAEKWARGEATIEELREARSDAAYAADDAAKAATYAAYAAAYAATAAAYAATYAAAAAYADDAAYAYAYAAATYADAYAAYADARKKVLAQCADIVRRHFPKPPTVKE